MNWYSKVSKDIAYLPDCIDHYYLELEAAKTEVKVYGNVEKAYRSSSRHTSLTDSINFKKLKVYLNI